MSKRTRVVAGCVLAGMIALAAPGSVQAQFWIGNSSFGWG
jgi:hypothetical protein